MEEESKLPEFVQVLTVLGYYLATSVSWFTNLPDPTRSPTISTESWANLSDYLYVRCHSEDNREQDWSWWCILGREENPTGRVVVTRRRIAWCVLDSSGHAWSRQVRNQGYASASIVLSVWIGNIINKL